MLGVMKPWVRLMVGGGREGGREGDRKRKEGRGRGEREEGEGEGKRRGGGREGKRRGGGREEREEEEGERKGGEWGRERGKEIKEEKGEREKRRQLYEHTVEQNFSTKVKTSNQPPCWRNFMRYFTRMIASCGLLTVHHQADPAP